MLMNLTGLVIYREMASLTGKLGIMGSALFGIKSCEEPK